MFYLEPPIRLQADVLVSLPMQWAQPRQSMWADHHLGGRLLGSFLEGPCFDAHGNLYIVDIPFGRIFRISPSHNIALHADYDGWPNGLKVTSSGRILVADHRLGLVEISADGRAAVLVDQYRGEKFRGLNDLTLSRDGWVYFTDQGQSGLQEPSGAVFRWHLQTDRLERVLNNIPSPVVTTHATDAPFHGESLEAMILNYADLSSIDYVLMKAGALPFYRSNKS
jgi:gluconolactonase